MKTLIVDNYDSFTYNLYQQFSVVSGVEPVVIANDKISVETVKTLGITHIVLSPGPGRPEKAADFGVCGEILAKLRIPVLGVCLGHQGIAHFAGGRVVHAGQVMHGRLSEIHHDGNGLFEGLPAGFSVVRYHSLVVANDLPACLEASAWTDDGTLMALRHKTLPFWGIQFHPESVCTEYGNELIANFLRLNPSQEHQPTLAMPTAQPEPESSEPGVPRQKKTRRVRQYRKLPFFVDPERVFCHLFADRQNAFWLDSSLAKPGLSRFSYMGTDDGEHGYTATYRTEDQTLSIEKAGEIHERRVPIFSFIKEVLHENAVDDLDLPFDFTSGLAGYLGYELKNECGGALVHRSELPDAALIFAGRLLVFDLEKRDLYLVALASEDNPYQNGSWFEQMAVRLQSLAEIPPIVPEAVSAPPSFSLGRAREDYLQDIETCLEEIKNGESYEICLTNRIHGEPVANPLNLYRNLREINPSPYAALIKLGERFILSSSPERFLKIDHDRRVSAKPIKGTLARHTDTTEDHLWGRRLAESDKDRAENLMIVDLLRNDLGKVCAIGSVHVPKLMDVETYATVHQLVSTVCGRLKPEHDVVDCVRAAFPGGSMTGAPKLRTMAIIDRLEREARGVYSGAIGFFGLDGTAELSVVIRTIVATPEKTTIGVGGAIVDLSVPETEFEEIMLKAKALIQAIIKTKTAVLTNDLFQTIDQTGHKTDPVLP